MTKLKEELFLGVFISLVAASVAWGDAVNPISEARQIQVDAKIFEGENSNVQYDEAVAGSFGPFNETRSVTATFGPPENPLGTHATAWQDSNILANTVFGSGQASTNADPNTPYAIDGTAFSTFDLQFSVPDSMSYTLSGLLDAATVDGAASVTFTLSDIGGPIAQYSTTDGPVPFDLAGTLDAGDYSIVVIASAAVNAPGQTASGSWQFDLDLVPEPSSLVLLLGGALTLLRRRR